MDTTLLMNHQKMQQKLTRMAYELFENNHQEKEIVLAGIAQRGYIMAQRIKQILQTFSTQNIILMELKVNKEEPYLQHNSQKAIDPNIFKDKVVVVVDDVLNSGKTLIYGVNCFLHAPVKKIMTMVLVNRNHKQYPLNADIVGFPLATTLKQNVRVVFEENNDAAYLE